MQKQAFSDLAHLHFLPRFCRSARALRTILIGAFLLAALAFQLTGTATALVGPCAITAIMLAVFAWESTPGNNSAAMRALAFDIIILLTFYMLLGGLYLLISGITDAMTGSFSPLGYGVLLIGAAIGLLIPSRHLKPD